MLILACAAVIALACAAAPAQVEHLGQPCRAKNILSGMTVVDRSTGRELFVVCDTNEDAGLSLVFIDFEKNTAQSYTAPGGSGSWAICEAPGDRLVIGTFYDGKFLVFDLKKMEFIKTLQFPGESYIWNLAIGSDGRIYGGSYKNGKLGALDLETYAVEDCGAPAKPNMYLRYVSATPDGRIFCNFGMEKPVNLLFDPKTKEFSPVPKHLEDVKIGTTWNDYFLAGSVACKGDTLEKIDLPFPEPPADKGSWHVLTNLTTKDTLYLRQGNAIYRYRRGDKALELIADIDLKGGGILAASSRGYILGVRGQDYFVIKPGDKELELRPIPAQSGPRPTMFLQVDDQGRIWGGPHFGQTLFWMDPSTGKTVNTGKICPAGGEVYDVAFANDKVYAVSYARGDIVCYDPEEPWDEWNNKNPKVIASLSNKGYIRPIAGVVLGPDKKLYSGWMAQYGKYGGAVAVTDPVTGATELFENPLGEQAVSGVAVDDKFIYVGTSIAANGLPHKKDEWAQFGILDKTSGKPVFKQTMEGSTWIRVLGCDSKSKTVTLIPAGKIQVFDTETMQITGDLPADMPKPTCSSIANAEDGTSYYGSEQSIYAFDVRNRKCSKIADLPAKVTHVAISPSGDLYASCGVDVYLVRRGKQGK